MSGRPGAWPLAVVRIAVPLVVIQMAGLSLREISGSAAAPRAYVPAQLKAADVAPAPKSIWEIIHRGSMPELQDPGIEWDPFYTDYVRAYLERDVRDIVNVKDESRFYSFMVACAARTGQLFNASEPCPSGRCRRRTATCRDAPSL